jgi:hypothetical protein
MTERTFRVERNGNLLFETNLNPADGVYLSSAAETYTASLGAQAPPDIEEVQGEMKVESEASEAPDAVADEAVEVTEEELEADEEGASYEDYTVEELKDILRERELMVSGTKDELIARLEADDEGEDEDA